MSKIAIINDTHFGVRNGSDIFMDYMNKFFTDVFYDRINIHMNPTDLEFDELSVGLLPWISIDNYDECMDFIQNSKSSIIVSHLELNGFKMMKGIAVSSHGMDPKLFSRYEMVLSGHYHTKSSEGNIHYLGTQYELTWADAGDPKHFHMKWIGQGIPTML